MIEIVTGPCIVTHRFRDADEACRVALPTLVHAYARATGLDVHPAETQLVECRCGARAWTEVRLGATIIASWREVE